MGKKSKAPPPPDYSGIANAAMKQAEYSYMLGQQQLAWAKEQYAQDRAAADKVIDAALKRQAEQDEYARKDRQRYEQVFQPLEDAYIKEANSFASTERQEQEAGKAATNVSQQFQLARTAAQDRLESMGIDPSQVRAGAMDVQSRLQEAAARASAANMKREQVAAIGREMQGNAINLGKGLPAQSLASTGMALQSGNQAVNSGLATTASGAQTMGTGLQWNSLGNQNLGTWSNALTSGYNAQMQRAEFNSKQSSGWGSLLGTALGVGANLLMPSDERVKENIVKIGQLDDGQNIYAFNYKGDDPDLVTIGLIAQEVEQIHPEAVAEDENGIKHVNYERALGLQLPSKVGPGEPAADQRPYGAPMPMQPVQHQAQGGLTMPAQGQSMVPYEASPSGGQEVDDVPARLTPGEFVTPKDVVQWKGEEFFQKLIEQSRKAKASAGAKPEMKMGLSMPATFQSP